VQARVKTGESISQAFEAQGGFPLVYTTSCLRERSETRRGSAAYRTFSAYRLLSQEAEGEPIYPTL
jgi:hypothetical protein